MLRLLSITGLLACAASASAGVVITADARLAGPAAFAAEGVTVAGKVVPWGDVLSAAAEPGIRTLPRFEGLRLRDGEVWRGDLVSLAGRKVDLKSDLLGKHTVELSAVAALEFAPDPRPTATLRKNTLYRAGGDPVPGTLTGLTRATVGVESLLGKADLPRDGLTRYVLDPAAIAKPDAVEGPFDEVTLIDGSRVRGKLSPTAEALVIEHERLGRLAVPYKAVRSVLRRPETVLDPAAAEPKSAETAPLTTGEAPLAVRSLHGDAADKPEFVRGLEVQPKTVVRFALPPGSKRRLRVELVPLADARGDVTLRISVGGSAVLERTVSPADAPAAVSVELPEGAELTIEADFGPRLRFPCGVVLRDPLLVTTK
jgi:hypothetical protein